MVHDTAHDTEPVTTERVVLLDERLRPMGTAPKATVHHTATPLHLAFSCYVFDTAGRLLLTRRSLGKAAWPGVWTNSFCGHPGPDEPGEDAVTRRADQELGLRLRDARLVLPDFRYRAVDVSGVVENEFCPVWTAVADSDPRPDPDEVCDLAWIGWPDLVSTVGSAPFLFSPWLQEQVPPLAEALAVTGGAGR